MAGIYKLGDDIVHSETFQRIDDNGDTVPILLSSLEGYGIEIYIGNNLFGKWGNNLTGFTDDYYEATGTSEVTWNIPGSEFTKAGDYFGVLSLTYTDASFPDGLRDLSSKNKVLIFRIN